MRKPINTDELGPIKLDTPATSIQYHIARLRSCKANGNPNHYMSGVSVGEAHRIAQQMDSMRAAMQKFVDRVDKGEVRSKRTYAEFKEILGGS
jgi:hypothetical protein